MMALSTRLDVMICTMGRDGLRRVAAMDTPEVPGVRYIVCCQDPAGELTDADTEPIRARADFQLSIWNDIGLSRNRNHALEQATAPIVLVADDDLHYTAQGLEAVIATMERNPDVDVAAFRYEGPEHKVYPTDQHDLARPVRYYYITSFELALRRESLERAGLRFSELAGLGAPYLGAGEESLLVRRALKAGLRGRFFPIDIVSHPAHTTGVTRAAQPAVVRARGAALRLLRGSFTALTRLPIEAWRTPMSWPRAMMYLLQGYFYSIRHADSL